MYTLDVGMDVDYKVEVRYQGRDVSMQQGIVKDFIGPYATAVLRFPPPTSRWVSLSAHTAIAQPAHQCGVSTNPLHSVGQLW